MKKLIILIFSLMSLTILISGQELLSSDSEEPAVEEVNWEELAPPESSLTEEELQEHLSYWKALHSLSLAEYLGGFQQFLEGTLSFYEMQPYVLAECLWFQISILPQFQQIEEGGSLDEMMDLNMVVLPDIQNTVSDFFTKLGDGSLPIHPWSDAVLSIFRHLVLNPPANKSFSQPELQKKSLFGENLPSIPALTVDHLFMPVDYSFRSAQLYGGIMDYEALLEEFNSAQEDDSQEDVSQEDEQSMPEIDWEQLVLNQPLMYILAHSESGREIYSVLRQHHSGETPASHCEDLYLDCNIIGEQWGFTLEEILPSFSATGIKTIKDDIFILYCLPENDLEQISSDLACLKEIAPVYFSLTVGLLYQPVNNEGVL